MESKKSGISSNCPPILNVLKTVLSNNEVTDKTRDDYWFELMDHCFDNEEEVPKCKTCYYIVNQFIRENYSNN